eukprot:TRINITY_DN8141_c0_g1_i1.p1 TRINITY_DN8141_c0_g1~~TRINITY_DN8141_c0_g1_i1.p1  ORF type:complete len:626 (-),score=98.49 TRINITY_DN8141_c0_g1_i1:146-2023(-)
MCDTLNPLCIIVVKRGADGEKLIFKYPFDSPGFESEEEDIKPGNPYSCRISEDILNLRVNAEPTNIKNGQMSGFTDEILANMFAVSKSLCGSKFELKVNDVRFVGHPVSLEPSKDEDGHWTSNITMFQIVFALKAIANYSVVQSYHELSQRIGLAIRHEEKRMGYLSQQTKFLISAMDEVINLPEDQQEHPFSLSMDRSSLAKDIKTIYHSLCSQGEVRLYLNKWIEISFCLPQKVYQLNQQHSFVEPETIFECLEELRPYHTLLYLVDKNDLLDSLSTDASPAMRRLVRQSSPLKSFRTLSVDTDLSLTQVFQLTGHLLYWGKATAIYPICESNVYVLADTLHTPVSTLLQAKFSERFNGESLLEHLAAFSLPMGAQVPPPMSLHQTKMTEIIAWLLRHGLIFQLHTYCTLGLTADMAWNFRQEAEKDDNPEPDFQLNLNLDPLKFQSNNSLTGSVVETSLAGSDAGSYISFTGSMTSDTRAVASELRSKLEDISELEAESSGKREKREKTSGEREKEKVESALEAEKLKEKRREELLREFTPEEKSVILAVPASNNLDDLARFISLCRYFRGFHHLEEIMYLENLRRSTLLNIVDRFADLLIKTEHEDPVVCKFFRRTKEHQV